MCGVRIASYNEGEYWVKCVYIIIVGWMCNSVSIGVGDVVARGDTITDMNVRVCVCVYHCT